MIENTPDTTMLARLIRNRNYTQAQFAKIAGVDPSTICRLCSGKITNPQLCTVVIPITRALGLSTYEVFPEFFMQSTQSA
jgi:transcriptional regulator with XRE-family HTH domain